MKWEYRTGVRQMLSDTVEEMGRELTELRAGLDILGNDEWELVAIMKHGDSIVGWFKRPVTP